MRSRDFEGTETDRLGVDASVCKIVVGQFLAEGGKPRCRPNLHAQRVERRARQGDDAHAACRTSGSVNPYFIVTSVARLMKSSRISSLVRCLIFHLRKISLFLDFEPPKKEGR